MSYASLEAIYEGIGAQINANQDLTVTLAGNAITFVPIYLDKKQAYLKTIQYDVQQYLLATLDFSAKNAASQAAQWNEQKSMDSSQMDSQTGQISALIENFKGEAQMDESDLQNAIAMQQPLNGYLRSVVNLLGRGF